MKRQLLWWQGSFFHNRRNLKKWLIKKYEMMVRVVSHCIEYSINQTVNFTLTVAVVLYIVAILPFCLGQEGKSWFLCLLVSRFQ